MLLLIFILVAYGASNIMVYGSIFAKWRAFIGVNNDQPKFFGKLFGCMMCLPFWWGIILSIFMFSPILTTGLVNDFNCFELFTLKKEVICAFLDGCLASGAVWFLHTLQEHLESNEE